MYNNMPPYYPPWFYPPPPSPPTRPYGGSRKERKLKKMWEQHWKDHGVIMDWKSFEDKKADERGKRWTPAQLWVLVVAVAPIIGSLELAVIYVFLKHFNIIP